MTGSAREPEPMNTAGAEIAPAVVMGPRVRGDDSGEAQFAFAGTCILFTMSDS